MIDILRGYEPALQWFSSLDEAPGLPGFVILELMSGCANKQEMIQLKQALESFSIFWPDDKDSNRALSTFAQSRLSHNLGIIDALIGECAVGRNATLCTFNVKHFGAIPGIVIDQPYERKVIDYKNL